MSNNEDAGETDESVRLDKWLWAARFYKTRRLAVEAISSGKVDVNGNRAKPAKIVKAGDVLQIHKPPFRYELQLQAVAQRRLSAPLARALYEESTASISAREQVQEQMQSQPRIDRRLIDGKPSKRDQRQLRKFQRTE